MIPKISSVWLDAVVVGRSPKLDDLASSSRELHVTHHKMYPVYLHSLTNKDR